ncbi:MAG: hypothetical protein M3354_11795 [Chloroflexota bacterium]|nr:hypothetical protein [Chloroflexota bacterium]
MRPFSERQPQIAFLLGKPVRATSVLSEVFDHLRSVSVAMTVDLPKGDTPVPPRLFDAELVVQRGLGLPELGAALTLEHAGVRCCNPIAATIALRNRAWIIQTLAAAGVPVPATVPATTWPELRDLAAGHPVVVKAADGVIGRGHGVLIAATGHLPSRAPFAGPYILQDYVRDDNRVYKVYAVGGHAIGVAKRWPPHQTTDEAGQLFPVNSELTELSYRAGTALDMEIYGVDILYGSNGPVVIDINPFPGFRGIPHAGQVIGSHLEAIVKGQNLR